MVASSGWQMHWIRRHTREATGKGEGAHREDGDDEAKSGRRPTTRIGGGASWVRVGDGAQTTLDCGGGAAEGQQDLRSKEEGLEEGEALRHGEEHRPSTAFAAGLTGETITAAPSSEEVVAEGVIFLAWPREATAYREEVGNGGNR
jgi:hypothetical protein